LALTQAEFDQMVGDHGPSLYRMAYRLIGDRHEAEDVVQDTFRSAWKSRGSFRTGSGQRAWLAAILRRRAVDHWRRPTRPSLTADGLAPEVGRADAEPGADECSDQMQRALGHLPDELREALLLVVVGELTHHEAAELLGVPLGTVLSRVSRARRRLRDYWMALQR
jgi:RNA polymerase sigma-70 factor (ECF subfamily)